MVDMTSTATNNLRAAALIALALAIGAMGLYVADADDAPGAAGIGLLLMIGAVVLGVKAARNRLPAWAARTSGWNDSRWVLTKRKRRPLAFASTDAQPRFTAIGGGCRAEFTRPMSMNG